MSETDPPRSIGPYRLEELLGRGGMAEVYRARRDGPGGFVKDLALKRILPRFARDDRLVKRFMDEARIAGALIHGNIVQINDFGHIGGEYFLVMEYIEGMSLVAVFERCMARGAELPIPLVAFVGAELGSALGYAHRLTDAEGRTLEVVHRDVSPQNVMLSFSGDVKLADFGIAKAADKLAHTEAGLLVGKASYMSPEQARGDSIDGSTDLFALGVVLWEALTLKPLLPRGDAARALEALDACRFEPPSGLRNDVPPELDTILMRALRREPEARYPDGETMARALRALVHRVYTGYGRPDLAEYLQWIRPDAKDGASRTAPPKLASLPEPGVSRPGPPVAGPAASAAPHRRWLLPIAALGLGLLVGGGGSIGLASLRRAETPARAASAAAPASSAEGGEVPSARDSGAAAGPLLTVLTSPPGAQVYVDGLLVGESPVTEQRPDDRPVTIALALSETIPQVFPATVPSAWTAAAPVPRLLATDQDHGLVVVRSAHRDAALYLDGTPIGALPQIIVVRWDVDGSLTPRGLEVAAPGQGRLAVDLSDARPWELVFVNVGGR